MLVTTVIPTYNRAKDLPVALDSALAQRYPAHLQEILVVDDGSTDETPDVVARYGDRVRCLRVPNAGVSAARNHGIAVARGEAIAFLDSDDAWEPDKLARQVDVLAARPDVGMVLTSMTVVDDDRRPIGTFSRRAALPRDGRILRDVLLWPAMTPSSALVRTSVAREIGGFDPTLRTAEDLDFHLKVALGHGIAVIDQPLLRYTRTNAGLGGSLRTYHDYVRVVERFVAAHAGEIPREDRAAALCTAYLRNARGLAAEGALRDALRYALLGSRHLSRRADYAALATAARQIARTSAALLWQRVRA